MVYDPTFPPARELALEQMHELSRLYWKTETPNADIERTFDIPRGSVFSYLFGEPADRTCQHCGSGMLWTSRQGRRDGGAKCFDCGHRDHVTCSCNTCRVIQRRRDEAAQGERDRQRDLARQEWEVEYSDAEHVSWAIRELTTKQRIFMDELRNEFDAGPPYCDWEEIARRGGVAPHYIDPYMAKLRSVRLLHYDGQSWWLNPGLEGVRLVGPLPRRSRHLP